MTAPHPSSTVFPLQVKWANQWDELHLGLTCALFPLKAAPASTCVSQVWQVFVNKVCCINITSLCLPPFCYGLEPVCNTCYDGVQQHGNVCYSLMSHRSFNRVWERLNQLLDFCLGLDMSHMTDLHMFKSTKHPLKLLWITRGSQITIVLCKQLMWANSVFRNWITYSSNKYCLGIISLFLYKIYLDKRRTHLTVMENLRPVIPLI